MNRRAFLVASTLGLAGLRVTPGALGANPPAAEAPLLRKPAKSTILFFLCGGASHIDMWDMKPRAPMEYRGEFQPIRSTSPDIHLCEHLPLLSQQAHRFALVHGITDGGKATGDHHAGYYYNLTGHAPDQTFKQQGNDRRPYPDDWPFMGSVVGSRRPLHPRVETNQPATSDSVAAHEKADLPYLPDLECRAVHDCYPSMSATVARRF